MSPQESKNILDNYYKDINGRYHRPNGKFTSNIELGIKNKPLNKNSTHGNSLNDNRINYGYALIDKNTFEILKFGETIHPDTRYSKKYLDDNNAIIKVLVEGNKKEIHLWQYDMNRYYFEKYKEFPKLLNSKGG